MFRIVGTPTCMKNSDNVDVVVADPVHYGVREPADPKLPTWSSRCARCANLGMCSNQIDRFNDRVEEFGAQTSPMLFVPG